MQLQKEHFIQEDPWRSLKAFTTARIALGRTGKSLPLDAVLKMKLAHANARDAVYSEMDIHRLHDELQALLLEVYVVESMVTNRSEYLKRPNGGRVLNEHSIEQLNEVQDKPGISIVIADGLSAKAINKHAIPVLNTLVPLLKQTKHALMPICLAKQGRVAIGDHIGNLLNADLTIMLIGERPGLTSPESMSAYITYKPTIGLTDESRNCISNIRPEGLNYQLAAEKICYLSLQCLRSKISGTSIKDNQLSFPGILNNGK